MDSTLDKRIAAMRGSLMDTALEAAESRGQRLAGVAHTLYALYRDDGFAGRLLRAHGLESAEIRLLMGMVPNMPLADGGKPVPNLSTRRILKHANDTLEVLRYLQGNDQVAGLLASHGIGKPDRQPTQAQVLATAHAALRDLRADMRLDGAWGATVDQYLERHPERWHDGAHDATMADAAAGLHVWWRWCEVNRWERGTWAVYTPLDDPADAALAVRLGERLRKLKPYSGVLDRMFTGFSDRLPNGERADTGWASPTSTAVMDDGLRGRMRRAIGARTWQEFLDAVYKLGLFRED